MNNKIHRVTNRLADVAAMETYWRQCRFFDSRPWDTSSIMGGTSRQTGDKNDGRDLDEKLIYKLNK